MSDRETLYLMFEAWDHNVIDMVYESNGRNLDRAIDELLQMGEEQEADNSHTTQSSAAKDLFSEPLSAPVSEPKQQRWRKPLPDDFLRVPQGLLASRRNKNQIEEDALLAQMLANENFRSELQQHSEFRDQFENSEDNSISWSQLSEAAKTKFNALATRFQRRNEYQTLSQGDEDAYMNSGSSRRATGAMETELADMSKMKIN